MKKLNENSVSKRKIKPFEGIMFFFLACYSAAIITLFVWSLLSSFKSELDLFNNPWGFDADWTFENWSNVFNKLADKKYIDGEKHLVYFEEMFFNSFLYSTGGALATTFCTAVMAYCVAKYKGPVSTIIYYTVVVTLIFPVVGNLASMLKITKLLKIYDNIVGLWVMKYGFNNLYFFIFYAAFDKISWEYAEAAFMDGASHFKVFFKVMLPLVGNLFGTVFLLNFIYCWNDFETAYMYLPNHPTVSVILYTVINSGGSLVSQVNTPTQIATAFMVFLPILVLFVIFKDKIMSNLTEGGIKG